MGSSAAIQPSAAFISDFAECHSAIRSLIVGPKPIFLARIGGSDADVVISHFDALRRVGPEQALKETLKRFELVRRFNGYYDKEASNVKPVRFCELMADAYFTSTQLLIVGESLLTEYLPRTINREFHVDNSEVRESLKYFIGRITAKAARTSFYPYSYIERILHGRYTMLRLFEEVLPGKRVLVVSPFSKSIEINFGFREKFFPNYKYPLFELQLYNAPITYAGLPDEFYPDADWFATAERMQQEVSALEFDIALLACGSYAMPLGLHISEKMRRKAIYMGGCLQLFFGVNGRRYDNPFFRNQMNLEAFIRPVERDRFLRYFTINSETAREAFGAYF
jgi:hypothetical protein